MNNRGHPRIKISEEKVREMYDYYISNKLTIKEVAQYYSISTGKMYYLFHDLNLFMPRKHRHPMPESFRKKLSERQKGCKLTDEQKRKISEKNSCNYNGLNGYGHTKKHNQGYILAYAPKHPNAHKDGYVMFHTVLMERNLGRYLNENEVVHHINHNKSDNRIENLMLMTKHEHSSMHMKERHAKRRNDLLIV